MRTAYSSPSQLSGGRSHLHAVPDDAHPVQQRLRLVDPGVHVGVEHALAHDVHPFGLVDDPELGGHPDGGAVLAEQVAAQAVEGGDPHGSRVAGGEHRAQPLRHLVGRLAGEGERGDAGGLATAGAHEVGDTGADHAGLSGPGAGDDEDRSVRGGDRFALAFVERGQELFMVVPGVDLSGTVVGMSDGMVREEEVGGRSPTWPDTPRSVQGTCTKQRDTASCCTRREAEANAPQGAAQQPGRKRLGHGAAAVDVIVSLLLPAREGVCRLHGGSTPRFPVSRSKALRRVGARDRDGSKRSDGLEPTE